MDRTLDSRSRTLHGKRPLGGSGHADPGMTKTLDARLLTADAFKYIGRLRPMRQPDDDPQRQRPRVTLPYSVELTTSDVIDRPAFTRATICQRAHRPVRTAYAERPGPAKIMALAIITYISGPAEQDQIYRCDLTDTRRAFPDVLHWNGAEIMDG